jgi:transcriptional regulator with XRE-family HTH domain
MRRAAGVGERVRELRLERGLTQADLAGDRFSKEYVSQVELGKTRPSPAALQWFAARLGVDPLQLAGESTAAVRFACEAAIARSEAAGESHRAAEALDALAGTAAGIAAVDDPALELRYRLALGWALHDMGRLEEGLDELARARGLLDAGAGGEQQGALVLFRMGVIRYKMGSLATAVSLFDEALGSADRAPGPSVALRAPI